MIMLSSLWTIRGQAPAPPTSSSHQDTSYVCVAVANTLRESQPQTLFGSAIYIFDSAEDKMTFDPLIFAS
jgi:hypothetical protein